MTADRQLRRVPGAGTRRSLLIGAVVSVLGLGFCAWLIVTDAPTYRFLVRLYEDKQQMRAMLDRWGILAPVVFIAIQALQVIIAPIPGDVTGLLGGFVFGEWLGFFYSTIGLTIGSLGAFWAGRRLGATFVQALVAPRVWGRMSFLVEAEGAILCFVIYLIPGLPNDLVCYLFGVSPMPFWVFAVLSTLGRMPGTWALSAQGAKAAAGEYLELVLLTEILVAVKLPLTTIGPGSCRGSSVENDLLRVTSWLTSPSEHASALPVRAVSIPRAHPREVSARRIRIGYTK